MLKRYGVLVLAFGLMISALSGQAQEQNEEPQGAATEEQSQPQILPLPLPVEIIESDAAADARQRSEDEAKDREIRDLVAQEGMNAATQSIEAATKDMRDYALYSTLAVWVGTILLFYTLWLTRQANRAAQDAVNVTRDMGQAQIRAYVHLSRIDVEGQSETTTVDLNSAAWSFIAVFQNYGSTPAIDIAQQVRVCAPPTSWTGGAIEADPHAPRIEIIKGRVMGPGDLSRCQTGFFPLPSILADWRSGQRRLFLVATVHWSDIFGGSWESVTAKEVLPSLDDRVFTFVTYQDGNSYKRLS